MSQIWISRVYTIKLERYSEQIICSLIYFKTFLSLNPYSNPELSWSTWKWIMFNLEVYLNMFQELSSKFELFQQPADYEGRLGRITRQLRDIQHNMYLTELVSHDSDSIQGQLHHTRCIYNVRSLLLTRSSKKYNHNFKWLPAIHNGTLIFLIALFDQVWIRYQCL